MATTVRIPQSLYPEIEEALNNQSAIPFPDSTDGEGTDTLLVWNTDLSAGNLIVVNDYVAALKAGIPYSLYVAIKSDVPTLRTFVGTNNPTAAQTATALKAVIRVLRALIRDV